MAPRVLYETRFNLITPEQLEEKIRKRLSVVRENVKGFRYMNASQREYQYRLEGKVRDVTKKDIATWKTQFLWRPTEFRKNYDSSEQMKIFSNDEIIGRSYAFWVKSAPQGLCDTRDKLDPRYAKNTINIWIYDQQKIDLCTNRVSDETVQLVAFLPSIWPTVTPRVLTELCEKIQRVERRVIPSDPFADI